MEKRFMKDVSVIMATCQKSKRTFGIRAEKKNRDWHFTWAFPIDEQIAKREGYDEMTIKGSILIDTEYPGCPYCMGHGFVHCNSCSNIVCWDGKTPQFKCPVCGEQGEITIAEEFDNIRGGGF